jgi:hypothetical protein
MEKQTSVEWLVENIQTLINNGYDFHPKFEEKLIEQAKQMEKQQIVEAHAVGRIKECSGIHTDGEHYYNETFNLSQQNKP